MAARSCTTLVQGLTFAILVLAANTSYQGFPRLVGDPRARPVLPAPVRQPRRPARLLERDRRPRGIAVLLIWVFNANVIALIHLYVIGVFTAFTLSQAGMVRYWLRHRDAGLAPVGGRSTAPAPSATDIVALLVIQTKFLAGAWAVTVAIPLLVAGFYAVNRHYRKVARRLRAGVAAVAAAPPATNEVVLWVDSYDAALRRGRLVRAADRRQTTSARSTSPSAHSDSGLRPRFRQLTDCRVDLEMVQPEDGRVDAVIDYLWALPRGESNFVTAIIPEQFRSPSLLVGDRPPHRFLAQAAAARPSPAS